MFSRSVSYGARGFDPITSLFEPDTLSSQQYFDKWHGAGHLQPEKRLMFTILLDAVECFQKYPFARGTKSSALFKDTEKWIFEDHHEWLFSFINICEAVGVDPHYLRKGLSRWKQRAIREQNPLVRDYPQQRFQTKDLPYRVRNKIAQNERKLS